MKNKGLFFKFYYKKLPAACLAQAAANITWACLCRSLSLAYCLFRAPISKDNLSPAPERSSLLGITCKI